MRVHNGMAHVIFGLEICAVLDESLHGVHASCRDCRVERRVSLVVECVDLRTAPHEFVDDVRCYRRGEARRVE